MKKVCLILIVCLWIAAPVAARRDAQQEPPGRDPVFEQEIYDRLAVINSDAVSIFQEATRAMDAGDLEAARQGFEQVLGLAPDFPDALRRLSYVELELNHVEAALEYANRAYEIDPSPYNELALARVLLSTGDARDAQEGLTHASVAAEALPDDADANFILLYAGLVREDVNAIRRASAVLVRVAPDDPFAHYGASIAAAYDGKWEQAERELLLARDLGMPAEEVQQVLDAGVSAQARQQRWLRRGAYVVGGWLAGLAILFPVGLLLSRLTLAAVRRPQPAAQVRVGWAERFVRALYRVVIALTSLYFYVSIPFVIVAVVAGTAGIIYFFLALGRIPVQLTVMLVLGALFTLFAILRSLFIRIKDEEPGRPLARDEAPQLWSLAEEVAARVGTRPVDAIYATPAPSISVVERGSLLQKLRGKGRRCLVLGLGALPGLTQAQLKGILAHEYGHFSNRDTAGGNLAHQVQVSMRRMAYALATSGLARWYNPAWLFLSGFNRLFVRITHGASRLQEILADRHAALTYGVRNFVEGLRHIVRQSLTFDALADVEINCAIEQNRSLQNLYTLPTTILPDTLQAQLEQKIDEEMKRPTSPYDSHPAFQERINLLQQLGATGEVWDSREPAWDLLPDAAQLQAEMTVVVQDHVRRQRAGRPVR